MDVGSRVFAPVISMPSIGVVLKVDGRTKNRWARYGPYPITITDGSLDLELIGKNCAATISGLAIAGAP